MQRQLTYNYQQQPFPASQMGHSLCPTVPNNSSELDPELIPQNHLKYKTEPYRYILEAMQSLPSTPQQQFEPFLKSVGSFYNPVPYHNITHAFDVMIACDKYLLQYKMKDELGLTEEDRIFVLIAAYAHDNGHQGLTNGFYINSEDPLALRYSNISPLQSMHSSNLLTCLRLHNITITPQHKNLMVSLILATDNKHHFELLQKIKQYQQYVNKKIIENLTEGNEEDCLCVNGDTKLTENDKKYKQTLLEMIIHTADISPCGKPLDEYLKWNERLYDQFKTQYRKQRELKLKKFTFNFDLTHEQSSLAKQNLSFLNNLVLPFFKEVSIIMPQFWTQLNHAIEIRNHFQQKLKTLQKDKSTQKDPQQKDKKSIKS